MANFVELLELSVKKHASDLHLSAGIPPTGRIDGSLVPLTDERLLPNDIEVLAKSIMTPEQIDVIENKGEVDFAYSAANVGRFRINAFKQRSSYSVAARVLNLKIPAPKDIGLPNSVLSMIEKKRGLVLVTGATGSGKSTTLACLIDQINKKHKKHILTLEDPIEYLHRHDVSIVNQREVGCDTNSFPNALRAALRQDPDVILVGEMRDLETISIAVTAAETGHLVLSTLHTVGAANTIDRILDVFPPAQQSQIRTQLADVLECVVSQQLLPTVDGNGRVAAFEVMLGNSAIKNHIREGKTHQIQSAILTNAKVGMKTMDDALLELYQFGQISNENALIYAQDRAALSKRLI